MGVACAPGCWKEDHSICCGGSTMGFAVGWRWWMVVALGLVISGTLNMHNRTHPHGLTICRRKGSGALSGLQLLACSVMLLAMHFPSSPGVLSSKMANGLLCCVCCCWMGLNLWMLEGAVGS